MTRKAESSPTSTLALVLTGRHCWWGKGEGPAASYQVQSGLCAGRPFDRLRANGFAERACGALGELVVGVEWESGVLNRQSCSTDGQSVSCPTVSWRIISSWPEWLR